MNQQYLLFKNKKKSLRTKTRSFHRFYENCLEKKDFLRRFEAHAPSALTSPAEAELAEKLRLFRRCGALLPPTPGEVDSLLSDDFPGPAESFDAALVLGVRRARRLTAGRTGRAEDQPGGLHRAPEQVQRNDRDTDFEPQARHR